MPLPRPSPAEPTHPVGAAKVPPVVSPAQLSWLRRLLTGNSKTGFGVDRMSGPATVPAMNLQRIATRFSRLNLTKAAREAAALKAEFRREDEELYRQGRGAEVLADRKKVLGGSGTSQAEVLTVNGVRIKS